MITKPIQEFSAEGHRLISFDGKMYTTWAPYTAFCFLDGYVGHTAYYGAKENVVTAEEFCKLNAHGQAFAFSGVVVLEQGTEQRWDVNPWHPMTGMIDLKHIGKLGEECGELIGVLGNIVAAISRCIIQGIMDKEPVTGKVNKRWLEEEIADVEAGIELNKKRFHLDREFIETRKQGKMAKLKIWHDMA